MDDVLTGFDDYRPLFSKRNNVIYTVVLITLIALNIYKLIDTIPEDDILRILKTTRTEYKRNGIIGIAALQIIPVILTFLSSLIPYQKMTYKDKFLRFFLVTGVMLNLVLFILFFVT